MSRRSFIALLAVAAVAGLALVYWPAFEGRVLAGRDLFRIFIPDGAFIRDSLLGGELPLWQPQVRLGQPFAAGLSYQVFYPPRLLALLLGGPTWAMTVEQWLHVALALVGTALAARTLGASRLSSATAGALFAFGALFTELNTEAHVSGALAFSGFLFAASRQLRRRPGPASAALLALAGALSFLAGAPEMLIWQLPLCAAVALAPGGGPSPRVWLALALAGLLAVALAAVTLLPGAELARHSAGLTHEETLVWSASWRDLASLFAAGANWPLEPSSHGQGFLLTLHVGAIACALALVSLSTRGGRRQLLGPALVAAAAAVLSLGWHFGPAAEVLAHFPFTLFRYPVKYLVVVGFLACLFAARGLDRLAAGAGRTPPSPRRAALVGTLGLVGSALALVGLGKLGERGLAAGLGSAGLAGTLVAAAMLLVPGQGRRRARRARLAVAALALAELAVVRISIGAPLSVPAASVETPSPLAGPIRAEGGRIANDELTTEWSNGGVGDPVRTAAYVARTRIDLVGKRHLEEQIDCLDADGRPMPERLHELLLERPRGLLDLAGVRWIVSRGEPPYPDLEKVVPAGPSASDRWFALPNLYRSSTALPRAFVVHSSRRASDAEARAALFDPAQPFRTTALLAPDAPLPPTQSCEGSQARIERASNNRLELEVEACGDGVLVVADTFYPGWRATLDGAPAPIFRADYLVRAIPIPAGHHRVEMRFLPGIFLAGAALSAAGMAAIAAIFLGNLLKRRRGGA